jgi:hypothetical protein
MKISPLFFLAVVYSYVGGGGALFIFGLRRTESEAKSFGSNAGGNSYNLKRNEPKQGKRSH